MSRSIILVRPNLLDFLVEPITGNFVASGDGRTGFGSEHCLDWSKSNTRWKQMRKMEISHVKNTVPSSSSSSSIFDMILINFVCGVWYGSYYLFANQRTLVFPKIRWLFSSLHFLIYFNFLWSPKFSCIWRKRERHEVRQIFTIVGSVKECNKDFFFENLIS